MVLVEDECKIQRESSLKSIWYTKGQQPTIRVDQNKEGTSFYGALDIKLGRCHLWDTTEKQNSQNTVKFLSQLEDYYQGKDVLLIWDGAPSHRGAVKKYLKQLHKQKRTYHKRRWNLEIMYFPPYWPKLNPQERVWKQGKQSAVHNCEGIYQNKLYNFRQYITQNKFKTNFLTKYASS